METLDPKVVQDVKIDTEGSQRNPYASGYGRKIPTAYKVKIDERWRRVWVMNYGNSGSAYVVLKGQDVWLDIDTEHKLQALKEGL